MKTGDHRIYYNDEWNLEEEQLNDEDNVYRYTENLQ
jgi:hypothetical protein